MKILTENSIERRKTPGSTIPPVRLGLQNPERKLVAEWQRGFESMGAAQLKLRLAFAPAEARATAGF
jgi:hypothetical protein